MADYFASLWTSLEAKVSGTWTGATKIYRATQSRRINWRTLLNDGNLTTPFVAVGVGQAVPATGYGVRNRTHTVPISLFYVRKGVLTTAEKATHPIVERLLEKLGKDMVDALLDTADTTYQVFDEPTVDAGDGNPANAIFIDAGVNLIAVEVTFSALIGE